MRFALLVPVEHNTEEPGTDWASEMIHKWIEAHYGQDVTCRVCGRIARVDPEQRNAHVVLITPDTKSEIVACEDCLQGIVMSTIGSLDRDAAEQIIASAVVELVQSANDLATANIHRTFAQAEVFKRSADELKNINDARANDSDSTIERLMETAHKAPKKNERFKDLFK